MVSHTGAWRYPGSYPDANFNFTHLKDPRYPEWFAYAAVDGCQFHSYKGSKWKTFFHLPRHLFTCIEVVKRKEDRK